MMDISVLGIGQYHPRGRTGVYRALEGLLLGLAQRKDVRLSYVAPRSLAVAAKTRLTLQRLPHLSPAAFFPPPTRFGKGLMDGFGHIFSRNEGSTVRLAEYADRLLRYLPQQWGYLKAEQLDGVDVFHSPFYPLPDVTARLCRVLTVCDLIPLRYPAYTRWNERLMLRQALAGIRPDDWVITISQATKKDLCELAGIAPERISVTPLAASQMFTPCADNVRQAQVRARYGIPPDDDYILSVATLEPRKNVSFLLQGFARLVQQESAKGLNLVLAGGAGWGGNPLLEQLATTQGMKGRIINTGYVQDEDLPALYSGAAMFVYPSLYEGFGLPPLEAMQCGTAVITSNCSSLPEVIGDAGLLVDPHDLDALCQAILTLWQSTTLRQELAARGRARAAQFSWQRCADQTVAAYRQALAA